MNVYWLDSSVLHDIAGTRPAAPIVAPHHTVSVLVFDLYDTVSGTRSRSHDGTTDPAVEAAVALELAMTGGEIFVHVFEKLRSAHVPAAIGKMRDQ